MHKLIVTTSWDDGSVFDKKIVDLLIKYGIKGTFYIPKTLFAHPLEAYDIREVDKYFEIGAHTLNHPDLTRVSLSEAKQEIWGSKTYLEDLLGHSVQMFCYPSGKYNKSIKKIVQEAGFAAARTIKAGSFAMPTDPYEWQTTMYASNYTHPLTTFKIWLNTRIAAEGLVDWETRAKLLFDKALEHGGIYHIWGHALDFEIHLQWHKLEKALDYIANREGVRYITCGEIFQYCNYRKD